MGITTTIEMATNMSQVGDLIFEDAVVQPNLAAMYVFIFYADTGDFCIVYFEAFFISSIDNLG